jgi:hypothetical protein
MPTLTNYWFADTDFRGHTNFLNVAHCRDCWAWINWSNVGGTRSTLVLEREDREFALNLPPLFNSADVLERLDALLGRSASRTSPIKAGWIPWRHVPHHEKDPGRHADLDLLIRIFFDFHISTPWYCSDADGDLSYYVVPFLDGAGQLRAIVDWWSFNYDGGGPFCTGEISDRLSDAVSGGTSTLQGMIDSRLALFADRRFDGLYLLPGDGTKTGGGSVNVNEHVSLALLPR